MPTSNFQPIRLLDPNCCNKFIYLVANSADPDQLASNLDLYCLQSQGISGFSRTRVKALQTNSHNYARSFKTAASGTPHNISSQIHMLWVLIRSTSACVSNEYPQHIFLWIKTEKKETYLVINVGIVDQYGRTCCNQFSTCTMVVFETNLCLRCKK